MNRQHTDVKNKVSLFSGTKNFYEKIFEDLDKANECGLLIKTELHRFSGYIEKLRYLSSEMIKTIQSSGIKNVDLSLYKKIFKEGKTNLNTLHRFSENDIFKLICVALSNIKETVRFMNRRRKKIAAKLNKNPHVVRHDKSISFMGSLVTTDRLFHDEIRNSLHSGHTLKSKKGKSIRVVERLGKSFDEIYYKYIFDKSHDLSPEIGYNVECERKIQELEKQLVEKRMLRERRSINDKQYENMLDQYRFEQEVIPYESIMILEHENPISPFRGIESSASNESNDQLSSSFLLFSVMIAWFYRRFTPT